MDDVWPPPPCSWRPLDAKETREHRQFEVTEFNSEVKYDLRGRLEVAMASEVIKIAVRGNMHLDTSVIKVAGFKSEVKLDL